MFVVKTKNCYNNNTYDIYHDNTSLTSYETDIEYLDTPHILRKPDKCIQKYESDSPTGYIFD